MVMVTVPISLSPTVVLLTEASVTPLPVTSASLMMISTVPVFCTLATIVVLVGPKSTLVMVSCSVDMKLNESDPIQTVTAMETATVTAMRMIAATTGLRAFLLFRSFIFCSFPPCMCHMRTTQ